MSEKNLFERVAEKNNTTAENVKEEIMFAVLCGNINAPELWANIHGTLEEQILTLAHLACAMNKTA